MPNLGQFPPHRITVSDDVRVGAAAAPNRSVLGAPIAGKAAANRLCGSAVVLIRLGTPAAANATGVAASQAVVGADNLTLASSTVTFDVPRNVTIDSDNAANTTQTATITGTDEYGQAMREVLTFNGVTEVAGAKAFKTVTQVAISAAITGNAFAGFGVKLGLPYRPAVGGFVGGILGENTADAGTYVAPERTTSTGTTVDVRGTYAPAGALNGSNIYAVRVALDNGPASADLFGIAQFAG